MNDEIKDLIEYKDIDINEFDDVHSLFDELDYDGSFHQLIDSQIDIYNYDLRKWAVDNWQYIEEAKDQGLVSDDADYHQQIQSGQYVYYSEQAHEALQEVFDELKEEAEAEVEEEDEAEAV
jgi:hypothetical protein